MFTSDKEKGTKAAQAAAFKPEDPHAAELEQDSGKLKLAKGPGLLVIARRYFIAALGCAAFALIYAQFSHGVYSPFMSFMFAIPLLGGVLPALLMRLVGAARPARMARQAWALAIASLSVASCLRGVFDIAGTASPYLPVYLLAALGFACMALLCERRAKKAS